jgi:cation diffusion facilitator family transporter
MDSLKHSPTKSDQAVFSAAILCLVVGIVLSLAKFYAYNITLSYAILSDALESIVNVVSASIALFLIHLSRQPVDAEHPYGHGKAELFSSTFEGGAISLAGILIVIEAIHAFIDGANPQNLNTGLIITTVVGIINGILGLYLYSQGKRQHSAALVASGSHVFSDFLTTVAVLIALFAVKLTGIQWLDPAAALVVGLWLAYVGFGILRKSTAELMDARDIEVIKIVAAIFDEHAFSGMIRLHHVRSIRAGRYHHVDAHLVVPEFWSVHKAHSQIKILEEIIMKHYPLELELHFHLDPCHIAYCSRCDVTDCPIRKDIFQARLPHTISELTSLKDPYKTN